MPRILIIDDELQIRNMLRQMLEREGYEVQDAPDGSVAMKLQTENPADLIITDIIMPEKEGLETIMDMRRNFPDVKIIAMSGGGRNEPKDYLNLARKLGAEQCYAKPIDRKVIIAAIKELIG